MEQDGSSLSPSMKEKARSDILNMKIMLNNKEDRIKDNERGSLINSP